MEDRSVPAALAWADVTNYAELTNQPNTPLTADQASDLDYSGGQYLTGNIFLLKLDLGH